MYSDINDKIVLLPWVIVLCSVNRMFWHYLGIAKVWQYVSNLICLDKKQFTVLLLYVKIVTISGCLNIWFLLYHLHFQCIRCINFWWTSPLFPAWWPPSSSMATSATSPTSSTTSTSPSPSRPPSSSPQTWEGKFGVCCCLNWNLYICTFVR